MQHKNRAVNLLALYDIQATWAEYRWFVHDFETFGTVLSFNEDYQFEHFKAMFLTGAHL